MPGSRNRGFHLSFAYTKIASYVASIGGLTSYVTNCWFSLQEFVEQKSWHVSKLSATTDRQQVI